MKVIEANFDKKTFNTRKFIENYTDQAVESSVDELLLIARNDETGNLVVSSNVNLENQLFLIKVIEHIIMSAALGKEN